MQCIRTFGFTAIALVIGAASACAGTCGITAVASSGVAPLMSQKAAMSKSVAMKKISTSNALSEQASALRGSAGGAGLALSAQSIGQSSALALQAGLTSQLGLPIAAHMALAPPSQMQGMASESSALALRAKNLVDGAGTADRAYALQPK